MTFNYIKDLIHAIRSLLKGMKITLKYFFSPKRIITQQYPTMKPVLAEKFRGEVVLIHDEQNEHKCTGCTSCEIACPNGTIKIVTKQEVNEAGKKKKALDVFVYHLELCTMCGLCVEACPTAAIYMKNSYEHSTFDRHTLLRKLNQEGSKLQSGIE
ncbi:MAG: NADH-quinone oxidoreductase subunit I [Alphaproteobacteria bacterium]|nr:NADH-quinone oxidoreductase subunit I [Alphaproteobacteria bacterium]